MATIKTSQFGNEYCPQAQLEVKESSSTGGSVTYSWTLKWITHNNLTVSYTGSSNYTVKIDGSTVKSGSFAIGGKTTQTVASGTKTINKGTSSRNVSISLSFDMKFTWGGSYGTPTYGGTKSASGSVSLPAKTSYTISYNANGGSGAPGSQTKWYGTNITLSSTKPTRTGYTFVRWNTNTSNTGTAYAPGATYTGNAGLTLYAIWTPITYIVSYNANGGSGAPGSQTKTYGVNLTLSSTKPTRTNYNFLGWSTSANGGVVYNPGSTYTNNAGVTLYAVWQLAYKAPKINSFAANRSTSSGTASETGTYAKVSFSWSSDKSVTAVVIQYKTQSASSWTSVTVSASGTSGSVSQVIGGGGISTEASYNVRAYVSDGSGTTYSTEVSIGTVKFPIDIKRGGTGVAIGKVAEKDAFEVGMDMYDRYGGVVMSRINKSITITGNASNYYPVVISLHNQKLIPQIISIWKDLGSQTASYSGNHSNGTSSLWLIYEGRNKGWDGNGGYIKTLYKYQGYATLVSHMETENQSNGGLIVWLRGGGTSYNIASNINFNINVYYSNTNIGTSSYPKNVAPRTDIGNGGIYSSVVIGYGNIQGTATYANGSSANFNAHGLVNSIANGVTSNFGAQNSRWCHYSTTAPNGHWFNKSIYVQGDIYRPEVVIIDV